MSTPQEIAKQIVEQLMAKPRSEVKESTAQLPVSSLRDAISEAIRAERVRIQELREGSGEDQATIAALESELADCKRSVRYLRMITIPGLDPQELSQLESQGYLYSHEKLSGHTDILRLLEYEQELVDATHRMVEDLQTRTGRRWKVDVKTHRDEEGFWVEGFYRLVEESQ